MNAEGGSSHGRLGPQLPLELHWDRSATLESFEPGDNAELVNAARDAARSGGLPLVLFGAPGVGKTHLLQAICSEANANGRTAVFLPLADHRQWSPDILDGLETVDLVALDDLDRIVDVPGWPEAVFHLFNRVHDVGGRFVAAARERPDCMGLALPDLVSRLQWGLVMRLRVLDDAALAAALRRRAGRRGLDLPDDVARYLLTRRARDMHSLMALLDRLDAAALSAKRRLTVPFVKEVLDAASEARR